MDLNAATPVALSSVHVLGDALANALIDDVKLVTTDDKGNTGTFIEITFSVVKHNDDHTETTDTKKIYLDVDDLISVYTPGDGINIEQTSTGLDGTTTTTTISLVAPTRVSNDNKIGGILSNKIYTGAVTN